MFITLVATMTLSGVLESPQPMTHFREAVSILEADPDMEVTFTRLDENGNEEIVTMSSRDLLDYVKEQEVIAKDEIQAVKALASCALRFGSEAA